MGNIWTKLRTFLFNRGCNQRQKSSWYFPDVPGLEQAAVPESSQLVTPGFTNPSPEPIVGRSKSDSFVLFLSLSPKIIIINQNSNTTINVGASASTTVNLTQNHVDLDHFSLHNRRIITDGEKLHVEFS